MSIHPQSRADTRAASLLECPLGLEQDPQAVWLFDYDLTLYPCEESGVLHSLDENITSFICDFFQVDTAKADGLRRRYWEQHGTTLAGLMQDHHLDPHDYFDYIHGRGDLPFPKPSPLLRRWLAGLAGARVVFTNARRDWAERGLRSIGIQDCFEAVFDLEGFGWKGKPEPEPYAMLVERLGLRGRPVVFLDDKLDNLRPAKDLGWSTVWVCGVQDVPAVPPWVDLVVERLVPRDVMA